MEYTRIVNDFDMVARGESQEPNREKVVSELQITYLTNEEIFVSSRYTNVPNSKLEKINKELIDCIQYNSKVKCWYNAISLITIISGIEKIIYS